jgi:toxin FitB
VIILDTNVLCELTRRAPDPGVVAWLDELPAADVATTAITVAELLYGVSRLHDGQRKTRLAVAVQGMIREDLAGRVEPFDDAAAHHYAVVVRDREQIGHPIAMADACIAAICLSRRCQLATPNVKDFADTGVGLINPWQAR